MQGSRGRMVLLGLAVLVAAAFAVPALAQNATEDATPSDPSTDEPGAFGRDDMQTAFAEALAAELDLPTERVEEALTAVREQFMQQRQDQHRAALQERLDQAVANGDLTQEQADAIADAAKAGVLGGRDGDHDGRRGFGHHGFRWRGGIDGPRGFGGFGDGSETAPTTPSEDAA